MSSALHALFALLFKYRPSVFRQGDLAFGAPVSVLALAGIGLLVAVAAALTYGRVRARSTRRDRFVLTALRVATLAVLVACLFRPMLLLSEAVPQRNFVGVLIDDSRSMQIADRDGKERADFVRTEIAASRQPRCSDALRSRFQVRLFRFGADRPAIGQRGWAGVRRARDAAGRGDRNGAARARIRAAVRARRADRRRRQREYADRPMNSSDCVPSRCRYSPSGSARRGSTTTSRSRAWRRRTPCSNGSTLVADRARAAARVRGRQGSARHRGWRADRRPRRRDAPRRRRRRAAHRARAARPCRARARSRSAFPRSRASR